MRVMGDGRTTRGWVLRSLLAMALAALPASAAWAGPPRLAAAAANEPMWSYRVQAGDNLFDLARDYLKDDASWRELKRINGVPDPLRLQPGTLLRMPIRLLRSEAAVAQALFVQGEASLLRGGQPAAALKTGAELHGGDLLRTGAQGSITVRFVDGSRLLLPPASEVSLEQLLVYGRSAVPAMQLQLRQGGADSRVQPAAERPPRYELRTPSLNLGVRGTEFRVQLAEDGRSTHVEVLSGLVAAGATPVPAGFGLSASAGQAPGAPTKLLPAPVLDGVAARLERIPLTLRWAPLEGASAWRAQVYADAGFEQLLLDGRFPSPQAQWADLPDGRYHLRVRAIDAAGLEGLAADRVFELKARPEPPFTTAPPAEGRVYGDAAPLAWTRPVNAETFRLQVAADAEFKTPLLLDRSGLAGTETRVALPPGHYAWRLASITAANEQGPFGDAQRFELRPVPPTPPLSPPEASGTELLFRWSAAPGAAAYQLQWAADPEFKTLLAEPRSEQPELRLPRPEPGVYYLRARSVDAQGYAGPYGTAQRVEITRSLWWWLLPLSLLLLHL